MKDLIVVLMGGISGERNISILSGKIDHIFYAYDEVLKCIKIY